ncbi:MAG TPA: hypothetical protein VEN81_00120, partial [Planctomycetota bacterium]|nr:hypothetical protein [Planctomycetota bacterium]
MEPNRDSLFGALAVQEGFASEDEVAVALEAQKDVGGINPRIGQILLEMGALNQAQIDAVLAAQSRFRSASGVPEMLPKVPARRPSPAAAASSPRLVQQSGAAPRVNDEKVERPRLLMPGDRLELGGAVFLFEGSLAAAPLLVPGQGSDPALIADSGLAGLPEAPVSPPGPSAATAAEAPVAPPAPPGASLAPAEPPQAPAEIQEPRLAALLDRWASRLLPSVHNHRKYVVALAGLGLVSIVLPWRIAGNGNTVVGLQGPGWLTFWLLGVTVGCAALLRVSRPLGRIEWWVMAGSSGAALLAGVWKIALPPAYATGRGIGLYLTLASAALVHGLLWLLRGSSSPAVAAPEASMPAALRLAAWAKRLYRD